jgi:tetratricopeptide (TPR) repeat protein
VTRASLLLVALGIGCASHATKSPEPAPTVVVPSAESEPSGDVVAIGERERPSRRSNGSAARERGCKADSTPADREQARTEFREGTVAFELHMYDRAIEAFERAYALTCAPALLYNLGKALEEVGDPAEAADVFELYLDKEPAGAFAQDVRARIDQLRRGQGGRH